MTESILTRASDSSSYRWIQKEITKESGTARFLIPGRYAAYTRILHPAASNGTSFRWLDIATDLNTPLTKLTQWHELVESRDPYNLRGAKWKGSPPLRGELAKQILEALVAILSASMDQSPKCYVGLWTGQFRKEVSGPLLEWPPNAGRDYVILEGQLAVSYTIEGLDLDLPMSWSPNLLWPDTRSWFVHTDMDLDSTLIGSSAKVQAAILESQEIEAWAIEPTDDISLSG